MTATTPEWRVGHGWTDEVLSARLATVVAATQGATKASSVGATPLPLHAAARGRREQVGRVRRRASTEVLAREGVGVPEPGGPFARARDLVSRYELSDPAIVAPHFDRAAPPSGPAMLLVIKVLGLRSLCAVIVGDVVAETSDHETRFVLRVDTL